MILPNPSLIQWEKRQKTIQSPFSSNREQTTAFQCQNDDRHERAQMERSWATFYTIVCFGSFPLNYWLLIHRKTRLFLRKVICETSSPGKSWSLLKGRNVENWARALGRQKRSPDLP